MPRQDTEGSCKLTFTWIPGLVLGSLVQGMEEDGGGDGLRINDGLVCTLPLSK